MKKKNIPLVVGIVVIVVITVSVTLYSGSLWGRWGTFGGLEEARKMLKELPMEIGDWVAEKEGELDKTSITMLQIQDSYLFRIYKHKETQAVVRLAFFVGYTGKIAVHTPEVCFGGRDYKKMSNDPYPVPFDVRMEDKEIADTFWRLDFERQTLTASNRISFYWALSPGEEWTAVEAPRRTYQKYRYVYKIQAESYTGTNEESDNVKTFLTDCLPTIHQHMRPYKL